MSGACLNIAKSMGKDNALFWGSILVAELWLLFLQTAHQVMQL